MDCIVVDPSFMKKYGPIFSCLRFCRFSALVTRKVLPAIYKGTSTEDGECPDTAGDLY